MSDLGLAALTPSPADGPVIWWAPVVVPASVALALCVWGLGCRSMFDSEADFVAAG